MSETVFIIGREPELSVAELEAVIPDWKAEVIDVQPDGVLVRHTDALPSGAINRLGGSVKQMTVLECLSSIHDVRRHASAAWLLAQIPDGRVEYGVSAYGFTRRETEQIQKHFYGLKAQVRTDGRAARFVTSKEPQLSSVTIQRQGLLKHGKEFVVFKTSQGIVLGMTVAIQDYQAYSLRDFGRPAADPKSGMVPPKLAQMMLNIAHIKPDEVFLDPFCGSGTILQEAALLGVKEIHGRDTSKKAIKASQENLRWLLKEFPSMHVKFDVLLGDARKPDVRPSVIVTEPYLGRPLHGNENPKTLERQIRELEDLYRQVFRGWAKVLNPGGRVVMIWPEFTIGGQSQSLELGHNVSELGFEVQSLLSQKNSGALKAQDPHILTYGREDAKVRRQVRKWVFRPD